MALRGSEIHRCRQQHRPRCTQRQAGKQRHAPVRLVDGKPNLVLLFLVVRRDEVEIAWRWTDSIIDAWDETGTPVKNYNSGTMGPNSATALVAVDGRSWYE